MGLRSTPASGGPGQDGDLPLESVGRQAVCRNRAATQGAYGILRTAPTEKPVISTLTEHYDKIVDKWQTLKEILEIGDFDAFLAKSGYVEKVEGGRSPNGSRHRKETEMNIQQFARKLSEKADQSPLLEALRALCTASMEQFQNVGFDGWIPWGVEDPPAFVKA